MQRVHHYSSEFLPFPCFNYEAPGFKSFKNSLLEAGFLYSTQTRLQASQFLVAPHTPGSTRRSVGFIAYSTLYRGRQRAQISKASKNKKNIKGDYRKEHY